MTDWATRVSTSDKPLREMQSPQSDVDIDETIAAIRRIVEENEHMLPADVVPVRARAAHCELTQQPAEMATGAALLPSLVPAAEIDTPRKFGLLAALTAVWR